MTTEQNTKPKAPSKPEKPASPATIALGQRDIGKFVSDKYNDCVVRLVSMADPGRVKYMQSIGYDFCTEGEYCASVKELNVDTKFGRDNTDKSRVIWDIGKNGVKGVFMYTSKENAARRAADKLEAAKVKERRPNGKV